MDQLRANTPPLSKAQRFHQFWLKITAIVVGSFGPVFFLGTMEPTLEGARLTLDFLSWPIDGNMTYASPDVRFLSALTGGFLLGWGVMIWCLSVWVYEKAPEAVGYTQGIVDFMNNREQKFPANSRIQPEAVYKSADDFMHYFNRNRNRTIEFLQTTQEPLSGYHANFRPLGDMNAFQWIVFIGAHTERHLAQIREVKSSPGYSQLEARH